MDKGPIEYGRKSYVDPNIYLLRVRPSFKETEGWFATLANVLQQSLPGVVVEFVEDYIDPEPPDVFPSRKGQTSKSTQPAAPQTFDVRIHRGNLFLGGDQWRQHWLDLRADVLNILLAGI